MRRATSVWHVVLQRWELRKSSTRRSAPAQPHAAPVRQVVQQETGLAARLPVPIFAIRVLFQDKFPPRPRTQNSPNLATVDGALIGHGQGAFNLLEYRIRFGGRIVQSRPVLIVDHQVNVRVIFAAWLYRDYPVANDITSLLRRFLLCLPRSVEILQIFVELPVFSPNRGYINNRPFGVYMVLCNRRYACKCETNESRIRGEAILGEHKFLSELFWFVS